MSKANFLSAVSDKAGISKKQCDLVLKAVVQTIQEELKNGNKVQIPELGTFKVTERSEKVVRNPRTNALCLAPKCHLVKFSTSSALRRILNDINN